MMMIGNSTHLFSNCYTATADSIYQVIIGKDNTKASCCQYVDFHYILGLQNIVDLAKTMLSCHKIGWIDIKIASQSSSTQASNTFSIEYKTTTKITFTTDSILLQHLLLYCDFVRIFTT